MVLPKGILVTQHSARGNGDNPFLVADGFGGVNDKVHDHLAYLGWVGLDGRQVVRKFAV